ncbi:RluA family pseudouridine synthase [Porticoccus sp. W117]|uniref:RluA family pseudouridine synthase n=1 Tax=Porticoccus sp. W117 TaxID=3054777 RepID=UPI002592C64C|nr:RluA family pseudouridine synthase [Porticoccus sp. W117]MDM3872187.1 RluA family pseudouridine synthase [Porticoccus sp. W117]
MSDRFELHLDITDTSDPVSLLAGACDLSKQRIKQVMQKGAVWLTRGKQTKRLRRHSKPLQPGQQLHMYYDAKVLEQQPPQPLLIVDEGDYSLWHKPRGVLSQGSKWSDHCTINRLVEQQLQHQRPAQIIHRLDRAASGLILIGHSRTATAALAKLFEQRQLNKRYRVVVSGQFAANEQTISDPIDGRHATSHVHHLAYNPSNDRSLLEVKIETGRKHQIRRHLAGIGFPVVGDRLYGEGEPEQDLQLTAAQLAFTCPLSGEPRHYQLPKEFLPHF